MSRRNGPGLGLADLGLAGLGLMGLGVVAALCGCAPAVQNTFTDLGADEQARICAAGPQVSEGGTLECGEGRAAGSVNPDYTLNCPELRVQVEGRALTVWAPTLAAALAVFRDEAYFLSYYAELRVRPSDGRVDADPPADIPEALQAEFAQVTVTVTPLGGQAQPLLSRGQLTPVILEPGTAYRIDILTRGTPNPWPNVTVDPASGTVQATLGS